MENVILDNPNLPANHQDAGDIPIRKNMGQSPPPFINKDPMINTLAPEADIGMNFHEALDKMMAGERLKRKEWGGVETFGAFHDMKLMLCTNGVWSDWIISDGDIMGTDWYIL